ncbi:MAG: hypothetical protein KW788_02735 [Candidatus Doudnabacteria bacterium]|nr:hypothetical protein [Candidatus Doudnabacteria bacterium]
MTETLVSKASRILRTGDQLSQANQKMKDAVHGFLLWFCPLVAEERIPFAQWNISVYGNGAWGLRFGYDREWLFVRSDGYEGRIKDYQAFCLVLADNEQKLVEWMVDKIRKRNQHAVRIEQIPDIVNYRPARSREPIELGRTDCPLAVLRSHPNFPGTLAPELEGIWTGTNPAWPEETIKLMLKQLDPPCHTDWGDFDKKRTEEKDGLTGTVVYVRPGLERPLIGQ